MGFIQNIRKHPRRWSFLGIFILSFPEIVGGWWALFYEKPLFPTIYVWAKGMNMPPFSIAYLPLIFFPLGLIILFLIYRETRLSPKEKIIEKPPEKEPLSPDKIKIDYKENEPNYYEESFSWPPDLVKDMSSSELYKSAHDLHRISIENLSQLEPIEDVKVEITKIEPAHFRISHNIPIKLRFMGDRKEFLDTSININPNEKIFVDVIQWGTYAVYDYNFEILNSENKDVKFKEGEEYILTIKASGKNAKVESRRFKISYINEPAKNLKLSFQSID